LFEYQMCFQQYSIQSATLLGININILTDNIEGCRSIDDFLLIEDKIRIIRRVWRLKG